MKGKTWKLVLCILVFIFSALSTAIGYCLMGEITISLFVKLVYGIIFILNPLLVIQLIMILYKKEN